jgi:hypothetical protein
MPANPGKIGSNRVLGLEGIEALGDCEARHHAKTVMA